MENLCPQNVSFYSDKDFNPNKDQSYVENVYRIPEDCSAHPQNQFVAEFHMPAPILAKIVSFVADGGVEELKNWIKAGPEAKDAVFSEETLGSVRLDKSEHFLWWSMPHSKYYSFYRKCVEHQNPYAVWAESNKGVAFEILVSSCFVKGLRWNPSYMRPDNAWRLRRLWRIGIPRCKRCRRPGHTSSDCDYQFE